MTLKICVISPLIALALCACELPNQNLGEANTDSTGNTTTEGQTSGPPEPGTTGTTSEPATTGTTTEPGTTTAELGTTGTSSGTTDEGQTTDETDGGGEQCLDPLDAPGVSKECEVAEDCLLVFHQLDCCGTLAAQGINADSLDAHNDAEAPCAVGAICDCMAAPTGAEDGQAGANARSFAVACVDNQCQSHVVGEGLPIWHETCGDPACTGHVKPEGVEPCPNLNAEEGYPCDVEGTVCDLEDECNTLLMCGAKDPKEGEC